MPVLALLPTVRTFPEPSKPTKRNQGTVSAEKDSILLRFDGLDEIFANNLHTCMSKTYQRPLLRTSVVVRGLPCFDNTTLRNFASSQFSIVSVTFGWTHVNIYNGKRHISTHPSSSPPGCLRTGFSSPPSGQRRGHG